jgi:SAM-dependent methyltransferase
MEISEKRWAAESVKTVACEYCRAPEADFVTYKSQDRTFSLTSDRIVGMYRCGQCALYFAYPKPSLSELKKFFAGEYYAAKYGTKLAAALAAYPSGRSIAAEIKDLRRRAKDLLHMVSGKRYLRIEDLLRRHVIHLSDARPVVLEIGGGVSPYLYLEREGFSYSCIEPSMDAVDSFRDKGYDSVAQGFAEDLGAVRTGSVDAIMYIKTLAHVSDLKRALAEARRVLRDGGIMIIADSNGDGDILENIVSSYSYYMFPKQFLSRFMEGFTLAEQIFVDDQWKICPDGLKMVAVLKKERCLHAKD